MHEHNGLSLTFVDIVQRHAVMDVVVRREGPGPCPGLVFELDHTGPSPPLKPPPATAWAEGAQLNGRPALRDREWDTPDEHTPRSSHRSCTATQRQIDASGGRGSCTCRTP